MSIITYRSIHLLKSLSNNAIKSIKSSSSLSHFIKINSPTLTAVSHIRRHYTTENINDTPGHILYYLREVGPLDSSKFEGLTYREKKNLKKTVQRTNKKRLFIKENIVETNFEALEDFNEWLRRLRFNKWASTFEGMKWQDIIQLNDAQLSEKGVTTFAVRSELLYYFNIIKEAKAKRDANIETPKEQDLS